jgi:hypothetical protein
MDTETGGAENILLEQEAPRRSGREQKFYKIMRMNIFTA